MNNLDNIKENIQNNYDSHRRLTINEFAIKNKNIICPVYIV
jgi:hypothetical protein